MSFEKFDVGKVSEILFVGKFGIGKFASENLMSENMFRKIRCREICCRKNVIDPQKLPCFLMKYQKVFSLLIMLKSFSDLYRIKYIFKYYIQYGIFEEGIALF